MTKIQRSEQDFHTLVFTDKSERQALVEAYIGTENFISIDQVKEEVDWYFNKLGLDDIYFRNLTVAAIAGHILALYAAKITAFTRNEKTIGINVEELTEDEATYINNSRAGVSTLDCEKRIDERYLDSETKYAYRLETYRSSGFVSPQHATQLRVYSVSKCHFAHPDQPESETDLQKISSTQFLERATPQTLSLFQSLIEDCVERTGPVVRLIEYDDSFEKRLVIGFKRGSTEKFFSALSDLYHYYDLFSTRKYVESFSNGYTVISLYLKHAGNKVDSLSISESIPQIVKEISLLYVLPDTPFRPFFSQCVLSVQETSYAYVAWLFTQHFLNRLGSEYQVLRELLNESDEQHIHVLDKIKKRLREHTYTRQYVLEIMLAYPELIRLAYVQFASVHHINVSSKKLRKVPSYSQMRSKTLPVLNKQELLKKIEKMVRNPNEYEILSSMCLFNEHVTMTNFYQPTKVALSFRFDPTFLPETEYPLPLFGMYFMVGSGFRGFHLRFQDVARGGIRIVRSQNREAYEINVRTLFDENYNLANTQNRKNKDIPEGGSKGTILLNLDKQKPEWPRIVFEKYIDCLLDLLIPGVTPGIKEEIVNVSGKQDLLFLGPDEGTAEFMNWASLHARSRGAKFWKAFTTGKDPSIGGIPHDTYGMTTRSVHQYVLGIIRKLELQEKNCTKMQTGGPDGDLGSNEILISNDQTVGIIDGSGVIFDPKGLDRKELTRLAKQRKMISHFDIENSPLDQSSPAGFRVLVDDDCVELPKHYGDKKIIERCLEFRNLFHLNPICSADFFVPCGGRPEAVNSSNVHTMYLSDGTPRFKYIVEGANLFFTQTSRLNLEQHGVIVFKDASTNKGGVTCSSLEVLAALTFTDEEFECMQVTKDSKPEFYANYVEEIQKIVEKNAEMEFECLWEEHAKTGTPRSVLSDKLSLSILKMKLELGQTSQFWENLVLREKVLKQALPKTLLEKLGYDVIEKRVPEPYMKAIFCTFLASRFVYQYGIETSQFAFFNYMSQFLQN
eukprot:Lithocolla_globosa_v1_NODE_101_length_6343_cov_18.219454.p1 type:complete len:1015 gc:universal NODE_101_length_6343_cov_18.219454:3103-59(-)